MQGKNRIAAALMVLPLIVSGCATSGSIPVPTTRSSYTKKTKVEKPIEKREKRAAKDSRTEKDAGGKKSSSRKTSSEKVSDGKAADMKRAEVTPAEVKLPEARPAPEKAQQGLAELARQAVAETAAKLNETSQEVSPQALSVSEAPAEATTVISAAAPGTVPPLGLASGDWSGAESGFRFHAAAARWAMADGRPDLAAQEARKAGTAASSSNEKTEAAALQAVASVMLGKESPSVTAEMSKPARDWQAVETARAGMVGKRGPIPVREAVAEVSAWPSPAAARLVPYLAAASSGDAAAAASVAGLARKLASSGLLDKATLSLAEGYEAVASRNHTAALGHFAAASGSRLGTIAARARIESLDAAVSEGKLGGRELVKEASEIAAFRTGDAVERRALKHVAEGSEGAERINALRRLERITTNPDEKARVAAELDKAVVEETSRRDAAPSAEKPAEVQTVKPEKANPVAGSGAEKDSAEWLLEEPEAQPAATDVQDEIKGKAVPGLKEADEAIDSADRLIESFKKDFK